MPLVPVRVIEPLATMKLLEGFMYFFNVWLIFVIIHLGRKYIITDVISRFIHEPYAMGVLMLSVSMGIFGWIFNKPKIRFAGNTISTFWWGTVWMLFLMTLKSVINLGFSVYGLPLVVSVSIMVYNFRHFNVRLHHDDEKDSAKRV